VLQKKFLKLVVKENIFNVIRRLNSQLSAISFELSLYVFWDPKGYTFAKAKGI